MNKVVSLNDNTQIDAALQEVFGKMVSGFQTIFDDSLVSIVLYGSVARGTNTDESDVDIALITRDYTAEMYDQMIDLTVDLELDYGKVLSVVMIDSDNFREWENVLPFYLNVKREGITLWNAA